jgi:hypothetical protein
MSLYSKVFSSIQCLILRYDWYETKGVFRQHLGAPREVKGKKYIAPALSDWQLVDGTIRAVTVGTRNPVPAVQIGVNCN